MEIVLAIVFASTTFSSKQNVAAVFEWVIALIFTFYVLTFFVDLLPAARNTQMMANVERFHMQDVENGNGRGHISGGGNGVVNGTNGHYKPKPPHNF